MKRNAIVLDKNLSVGEIGNISAILMGQVSKNDAQIFSDTVITDLDEVQHAEIKYSTVILKGGAGQIINLAKQLAGNNDINSFVFTALGQSLNNKFSEYADTISQSSLVDTNPIGIIISGDDEKVRQVTKKFSLLQ